nr:site-specific integrase [Yoonia sediminilitoris]
MSDITAADVLAALLPIWTTKQETARRVKQRIGTVMKWAVAQGFRQDDPSAAIQSALPKVRARPKHRKALPYADVAECVETVVASGAGKTTKLALEFLILTAARSGEVRLATWSEIDFDKGEWCVPADRMKAGVDHRVPLSLRAVAILNEARAYADGSDLVFPGSREGKPMSDMTLSKLVKSLGYDVDVHGFRTSFRTWAQEQTSFPHDVVEKALAHTIKNKSVAAYARSDLFEKRHELMNAWARYIDHHLRPVTKLEVVR